MRKLIYLFLFLSIGLFGQYPQINKQIVFAEYFDSEAKVIQNGGTPSNVAFAYGEGTFNGTSSKVNYDLNLNGTYSVRIKCNPTSLSVSNNFLFDSRGSNIDGTGAIYITQSSGNVTTLGGGTIYVNSVATAGTTIGVNNEIVVTGISLNQGTGANLSLIGSALNNQAEFLGTIDYLEIWEGTLDSNEISLLYDGKYYRPFPDMVQDDTLQLLSKVTSVDGVIEDVMNDAQGSDVPRTWVNVGGGSGPTVINGDVIDFTASLNGSGVKSANTLEIGKTYNVSATISNMSGGGYIMLPYTGSIVLGETKTSDGTYSYTHTATATDVYIYTDDPVTATVTVNYIQELRDPIVNTNVDLVQLGNSEVMSFNSTDSKLDLGVLDNTGNITTYGWFFAKGLGEGNAGHIYSDYNYYSLYIASNKLQLTRDGAGHTAESASVINLNKWVFYCATSTESGITNLYIGYIDNAPVLSGSANQAGGTPILSSEVSTIGNRSIGDRTFDGYIWQPTVYRGILSLEQLVNIWNTTKPQ